MRIANKWSLITLALLIFLGAPVGYYLLSESAGPPQLQVATAVRRELNVVVSTNGIIEPVDRTEIYAPIDAFVTALQKQEGSEVTKGSRLMQLESQQLMTALSESRAALSQAKHEAQAVVGGPPKEDLAAVEASLAENDMQLNLRKEDLREEEALLKKSATTRTAVETLQAQVRLLELNVESLRQKKQVLLNRYSAEEKQWEQDRVAALTRQVELLDQQLQTGSIIAPESGILYSLSVKTGSYVNKGQLLAQIYRPGKVQLKAYVDEPDLGRIAKGQRVTIEWDGLPDGRWNGTVDRPAKQVQALGNRSVGTVMCSIDGQPKELIPNINVKVQIVTARKTGALAVPRAAVFNHNGRPAVMVSDGMRTTIKSVVLGLITPEEIEILQGIDENNSVVTNPGEARTDK